MLNYKRSIQLIENFSLEKYAMEARMLPNHSDILHDQHNNSFFEKDEYLNKYTILENGSWGLKVFGIADELPEYVVISSAFAEDYGYERPLTLKDAIRKALHKMEASQKGVELTRREASVFSADSYDLILLSRNNNLYYFLDLKSNLIMEVQNTTNCGGQPYIMVAMYLPNNALYNELDVWNKNVSNTQERVENNTDTYRYSNECQKFVEEEVLKPIVGPNYAVAMCDAMGWDY